MRTERPFSLQHPEVIRKDRTRLSSLKDQSTIEHRITPYTIPYIHHTSHVHVTYSVVAGRHPKKVSFKESN